MDPRQPMVGQPAPDEQKSGLLGVVFGWIQHPFLSTGTAWNWAMILILLIIVWWFWNHILMGLVEEI